MSRKKTKKESILTISAYENTLRQMPKYNVYQCGTGVHETSKYPKRAKSKSQFRKMVSEY